MRSVETAFILILLTGLGRDSMLFGKKSEGVEIKRELRPLGDQTKVSQHDQRLGGVTTFPAPGVAQGIQWPVMVTSCRPAEIVT